MQKVAFTPLSFSTCRTCGVQTGSGPSSMVMLTPRAPWSEAWTMLTATGDRPAPAAAEEGCAEALECCPLNGPACAVHTDVAAATAVTPTAAANTRPYHPRPPCRAMSACPCHPGGSCAPVR